MSKVVNVTSVNKYGPTVLPEGVPNAGGVMSSRSSEHVIVYGGKRFGVGYSEADTWVNRGEGMGRKFITEPEGYSFGLSVCIDNYGGTGAEAARNRAAGTEHDVEDGDLIVFDTGVTFEVRPLANFGRLTREYLALVPVGTCSCPVMWGTDEKHHLNGCHLVTADA